MSKVRVPCFTLASTCKKPDLWRAPTTTAAAVARILRSGFAPPELSKWSGLGTRVQVPFKPLAVIYQQITGASKE